MPISVSWYFEDHIVSVCLKGIVTNEEVKNAEAEINAMLEECPVPVFLLVDDREITRQPGINAFSNLTVDRKAIISIVNIGTTNPVQRFVAQNSASLLGLKIVMFNDSEDALEYIYRHDPIARDFPFKPEYS